MQVLNSFEIDAIHGAASTSQPIDNPQSETGKTINDIAQLIDNFGSWLGGKIYDQTH